MKAFTATHARNQFGAFLDAGMVEGVKVVRNNRVLGYFIAEREYEVLRAGSGAALYSAEKSPLRGFLVRAPGRPRGLKRVIKLI